MTTRLEPRPDRSAVFSLPKQHSRWRDTSGSVRREEINSVSFSLALPQPLEGWVLSAREVLNWQLLRAALEVNIFLLFYRRLRNKIAAPRSV
jgi:hypothetical protein